MPENETPAPRPTPIPRQSAAQRRAALISGGAERLAQLRHEAAERRAARALAEADTGPRVLGRIATQRRLRPR
jgi:hypothetical protein